MAESEPKYEAKSIGNIDNGKGYWNYQTIGVFLNGEQCGTYVRNYGTLYRTFFPFEQNGQWFALYSKHYTATRIMSLPDCKDLGGEEPESTGFCPVEFFVPELTGQDVPANDPEPLVANHDSKKWAHIVKSADGRQRYYWPDAKDHPEPSEERLRAYQEEYERSHKAYNDWMERNPFITKFASWGFVAGCHWGDDSSWKIEFLDLSRASEGILKRDWRFGYIELPARVSLKDAIGTESIYRFDYPPEKMKIEIALPVRFSLDGKRLKDE